MDYLENVLDKITEWVRKLIEALRDPETQPEPEPIPIPVDDWSYRRR
jgi:hypothetical protein